MRQKKAAKEAEARRQKLREEAKAAAAAAEQKRLEEEAAEKKRLAEEVAEKKRLEEEAAEQKRLEEAEAEKKRLEEEEAAAAEKKRLDDEAAATIEKKRLDDEVTLNAEISQLAAEEDERLKIEAEQQKAEEQELKRQEDEEKHQQEQADLVAADAAVAAALQDKLADAARLNPSGPTNVDQEAPDPFSPIDPHAADANVIPEQPEYEESVLSEMSEAPGKVQDRLDRVILWKAQIVEIENQIRMLKAQVTSAIAGGDVGAVAEKSVELQRTEKVLRKMQKKEQRRWDNGVEGEVAENPLDTADTITLDGLGPGDAKKRVQEKLEELLSPTAKSLKLTITPAKGKDGKKHTKGLTDIFVMFLLLDYTKTSTDAIKMSRIDIPPEDFATWLTAYRIAATREESEDW
ncbi:hypothetical protein NLJ89_g9065 [Agrocybe chaxingu]|uniref:Uncharacterized protein n=1 Tax=Agrocybe chaxingu TaxID=84603 RepID=A0A9W8JRH1_9AGAR|nr:hypothetical protein NLJ89_g9065 [Agrocybe chaxingu]